MTLEDIITLTKAGFTKEEILKLHSLDATPVLPAQTAQPDAPKAPAPASEPEEKQEEKEDISKVIEQKIGEAFKPFETLYNNIAIKANMPTIGEVEPRGIDDIISDFFTK